MAKINLQLQGDCFFPYDDEAVAVTATLDENSIHNVTFQCDDRSSEQNRMQFQWFRDLEKQGDQTASQYRGYCKLCIGVPILRQVDEEFREVYDKIIRPLDYPDKLALMVEPIDLPVTSRMDVKTMTRYLDEIVKHFSQEGFQLTDTTR